MNIYRHCSGRFMFLLHTNQVDTRQVELMFSEEIVPGSITPVTIPPAATVIREKVRQILSPTHFSLGWKGSRRRLIVKM